ncbi:winged helix-turn-helix transcriptional regulator [Tetragenococcus muriaticus]|uniref:HxlR family transcriptional regulator n=2 Tax=Tetragenococcus muriaticus TaxID=64642 RepID=A0A091C524_9ENTE|nr:helix-turn-helix domain-containing protein [Tetragenococcus muriaticus]KFN91222.1 HxlR family transcriptional regulator [Tetragenococcus muriaticus 3MR10-3]KFN91729.1 HxlR family transcriptional regulator [Tetragenococcus muriaticus PMC-11-5]
METKETTYTLCPKFEKAFSILGKKWNGLIIDVLLQENEQRFVDMAHKIPMLSDRVLAERLKELEKEGIVSKTDGLYQLTDKGIGLKEVLNSVRHWSQDWLTEKECNFSRSTDSC